MTTRTAEVAIVGGGIAGLAHALAAARRGRRVVLFERDARAVGASIRNFGLIWPVGQRPGYYQTALRSREIWLDVLKDTDLWYTDCGSLHLARHADEVAVLEEFLRNNPEARAQGCEMLEPADVARRSDGPRADGLLAALWSPTELNVDPRTAIPGIARYLADRYGVELEFGCAVHDIALPEIRTTGGTWQVEQAIVCSGNDLHTLYPDTLAESGLRRCKLQMMRTVRQPDGWQLGPALCGGLTLLHYASFEDCPTLPEVRARLDRDQPGQRHWGVHVLASQTAEGQVTLGDSHEYAPTHDPFVRAEIDDHVLDYFDTIAQLPRRDIAEHWAGEYPSLPDGRELLRSEPEPGVTVVNGFGGAGMTLSFGVAEQTLDR